MKDESKNRYKLQGGNKEPRYYEFDWEVDAILDNLPQDYFPCVVFKPDGTIHDVRQKRTNYYGDGGYK